MGLGAEGNSSHLAKSFRQGKGASSTATEARTAIDLYTGFLTDMKDVVLRFSKDSLQQPFETACRIPVLRVAASCTHMVQPMSEVVKDKILHQGRAQQLLSNGSSLSTEEFQGAQAHFVSRQKEAAAQQQDITEKQPTMELDSRTDQGPAVLLMDWSIETLIALIFGVFFYKQKHLTGFKEDADPRETFRTGHFTCCEDSTTCVVALCCPGLRWADTVNMSGIAKGTVFLTLSTFWSLFLFFSTAALADAFGGLCLAVLLTYYRQKLRQLLDFPHGSFASLVTDFLFALFCPCCLIAQEARVVNEMALVGHIVVVEK